MKSLLTLIGMALLVLGSVEAEVSADFYVSNAGSDQWSGRLELPNADGSDGPFATLLRARDAVRQLKQRESSQDIVVLIRGGWYPLSETLVFGLEDSGDEDMSITYAAYPGEEPVFSSGKKIEGWNKAAMPIPGLPQAALGNVWVADVSDSFRTLFDADGLLPRARSAGFIPLSGGGRNRVNLPAADFRNWSNVKDAEIVIRPHHAWIVNILPIESIDEQTHSLRTSIEATYLMDPLKFLKSEKIESCWVENVFEALDEPGEWVLDAQAGKVYLWPRSDSSVVAPQLTELIRVEGRIDKDGPKDIPVRHLRFVGLTFKHGERYQIDENDAGLQHDWDFLDKANALVRFRGTEDCVIEQCHFLHSGSGAIRVDLHGQNNRIVGNHIEQMGGSGVLLAGYGPGTKDVNRNNLVYNNHIHHVGQIYWHSPGIFVWQSGDNRVANNLVHHTPYTAIILSGCMTEFFGKGGRELTRTIRWDEIGGSPKSFKNKSLEEVRPFLHTHDNLIERNEIHHAMEKLGDGNAIYIRGAGAGNVIRGNYIHHLVTPMIMQCAIRTDGGQMDTLITGNLIYKCTSQGIMLKLNNRCENNIIADVIAPPRGYYLALREGPMAGATIQRNIFYSSGAETVFIHELGAKNETATEDRRGRGLARSKDAETDYNIYYNATDPNHGRAFLEEQQEGGVDAHSRAVDPLFVDPAHGDFRFRPDSPALKMGIQSFDRSTVGLIQK